MTKGGKVSISRPITVRWLLIQSYYILGARTGTWASVPCPRPHHVPKCQWSSRRCRRDTPGRSNPIFDQLWECLANHQPLVRSPFPMWKVQIAPRLKGAKAFLSHCPKGVGTTTRTAEVNILYEYIKSHTWSPGNVLAVRRKKNIWWWVIIALGDSPQFTMGPKVLKDCLQAFCQPVQNRRTKTAPQRPNHVTRHLVWKPQ